MGHGTNGHMRSENQIDNQIIDLRNPDSDLQRIHPESRSVAPGVPHSLVVESPLFLLMYR